MRVATTRRIEVDARGLEPGATRVIQADGCELLLCNVDGELFAFRNACPHQDVSLAEGRLRGPLLECPLHGGRFDVRDGRAVRAPTRKPLETYRVVRCGERVEIVVGEPAT